jgi:hypothetical protein
MKHLTDMAALLRAWLKTQPAFSTAGDSLTAFSPIAVQGRHRIRSPYAWPRAHPASIAALHGCDKRCGKHFSKRFLYPSVPWPMRHFLTLKI